MQMLLYPFLQVCKIVKISCQCLRQLLTLPLNVTASPKVLCWQGCPMQIGVSVGTEERRIKDHHPYLQFCLEQIKSMQSPCSKKLPRIRLKPTKQLVVGEQNYPTHSFWRLHVSAGAIPAPRWYPYQWALCGQSGPFWPGDHCCVSPHWSHTHVETF